ncbi:hypothetical protein [Pseudomonas sp. 10S4]|uniref:hypothetical protein n=1 Tax=Pseudomonas sp. 10S4 TaxID=3048583 RepID=UPI002AC9C39B|nr:MULTISPECIES: hypothetical protein [unclassified Pseudomonas]MEB0226277.1 hypothetical protein [Pseudomonas sp. 5S1]MEB0294902.1 hypothetical protein [Pseudomonas sp. 10S4]WPX18152.1 hypothetical protein RHM58_31140 [Pseudomonas sp. 10S4]
MTDHTELKRLLDACRAENCNGSSEFGKAVGELFDVCTVETIADLVAENERLDASFKNFHRSLCARFGYYHDDIDWQRDQVSLEEHLATQFDHVSAEAGALRSQMEVVQRGAGQLKAENESMAAVLAGCREFIMSDAKVRHMLDETGEVSPLFPRRKAILASIDAATGKGEQA